VDNSDLTSNKAYLESKIEALSGHLKAKENTVGKLEAELEKNLDAMRIQLEANASLKKELETQQTEAERVVEQMRSSFDADRKSQDKIVDEIISAKEEALLREEVLLGNVDALTKEAAVHVAQVNKLTAMFNEANQERDSIASKYEASRQQVASLLDNNHSAQKKADDLINHYMKIEDELRQQLQSVQGEKTSLERKLKVVQRESDRLLGEFCTEKHGLTNIHATQVDLIKELETQIDDLTTCNTEAREKIDHLSKEVDELRQYNTELIERVDSVCSERDASSSALAVEREQYDHDLKAMEQRIESERLAHASALTELQSIFNIEKEEQATKANTQEERICTLACEAKELKEDVEKLKETREDQKRLISQLKASLKDALDESNRLESKITAEQDELSKVTNTMTSIEEENFNLNQSLHQSRSEVDKLATILALQEPDLSDLESSLQKVIEEKARLENELSDKETKLFKTMNALTHFELKLARAEQERDAHSDRAHCEITRLQNELTSQVTMHQVKEAELESQIVALKKECDVEYEKNEDYEVVTSSLKEELHTLSEENVRLSRVNANIITANEAFANENSALAVDNEQLKAEIIRLTENLATVKSKIDCVKSKIAVGKGDDSSTKSGDSMANQVKKTASELQSTVKAIKKHHDQTVKKLQSELDDARKRVKKYEGKVNDLTTLIEENACVIESLHQKLRGKSPTISSYSSPRQSYSNESEVTE
jgi:chromosome segregation ATPase